MKKSILLCTVRKT